MKFDFKNLLNNNSKYVTLLNKIESKINCSCFGLNLNEISYILSSIKSQKILVVNTLQDAIKYETQLKSLGLKTYILSQKIENYSYSAFTDDSTNNLLIAMFKLITNEIDVLICLNKVLMQKLINPAIFKEQIISFKKGKILNFNNLAKKLTELNYKRVDEIVNKGEFTLKGDILSIFPINLDFPVRVSFFDDEIEKISLFSLETYETLQEISEFSLCPNTIYFYTEEDYQNMIKTLNSEILNSNEDKKVNYEKLLKEIENRTTTYLNSSFIIPFIKNFNESILDFLTDGVVVYLEPKLILDQINSEYINFYSSVNTLTHENVLLNCHKNSLINKKELFKSNNTSLAFLNLNTSNKIFESQFVQSFLSNFTKSYNQNFNFLLSDIKNLIFQNYKIVLCADSNDKALKMQEFLKENDIFADVVISLNQIKNNINILVSNFYFGATFVEDRVILLGNYNIYGNKKVEVSNAKVKKVFFTPSVGDYVVHETHGICKCKSIEKVTFNAITKDYIVLEFFGGDTLYLPSEKTNLITKFIGDTENPKLNKLGSTEFLKEKNKVKQKVKEMAFDLLKLYAERETTKGFKYNADDEIQREFENAFPYELTFDQEKAIKDMKEDMEKDKVMDRLICGDVGYGKTEVAIRGAFKAVLSGKQVAFLSPTTILSEQHFKIVLSRLKKLNKF